MTPSTTRKWSARRRALVVVPLGVLAAAGAWWAMGGALGDRPLAERLSLAPTLHPVEMTEVVCTEARGMCVEGWRTDAGDFQRFASVGEAEYWAIVLGDAGRRNGTVVLNMTEAEPSLAQTCIAVDVLFSDRDWN